MPGPQSPALHQALLTVATTLLALPAAHALPTQASGSESLTTLVNAYRANPGACEGRSAAPAAALDPQPALAQVRIGAGTFIESAL